MKKMNKRGFTIVELSIVIAVIAILSAVLVPTFSGMVKNSKDTAAMEAAKNAQTQYIYNLTENDEDPVDTLIYNYGENRVIVIKGGKMDMYATVEEAKVAIGCTEDNAETGTTKNYTENTTDIDGLTAYVLN